jgi:alkylation response protein AidB-like acyl-CoA dehydrogenase
MASEVLELAVDYAKGREQFSRPIGSFQAIKHLLADCLTKAEAARCAVQFAAALHDQEDVAVAEAEVMGMSTGQMLWRLSAGAKLLADEAAIANARTAVQVYGGMGFTWEVPIHLYLKRARVLATRFGNRKAMAETVAALY